MHRLVTVVISLLVPWGTVLAGGIEQVPCEVELVDERHVAGKLAYQDDSLVVVYSPSGGTLRSFPKALLHAISVGGERTEINETRELTDAEAERLGRLDWPDAVPTEGRKPAYTGEEWEAPYRLIIWRHPGKSGVLHDPDNWIVVGGEGEELWPPVASIDRRDLEVSWLGTGTDILLPSADKPYQSKFSLRPAGIIKCRHVAVERNAQFNPSTVPEMRGNLWVARDGAYRSRYTTAMCGERNTFFFNDQPRLTPDSPGAKPVRGGHIIPVTKSYGMAQYLTVRKEGDASVEFAGTVVSSDDFQMQAGTAIVAENSQLWAGTRSTQRIRRGTTLRLMSGAEYGKAHTAPGSGYGFRYSQGSLDIIVAGRIEAGSDEHPITEEVRFGVSFKAPIGFRDVEKRVPGAIFTPSAEVVVHTAAPDKAKLVIGWHGRHNAWFESRLDGYKEMPEEISIAFCGEPVLQNVRFEDLAKGGLFLEDPSVAKRWENVTFGESCRGERDELIVKWPDALREPIVSDKWYRASAEE